jgi:hypothetical protein
MVDLLPGVIELGLLVFCLIDCIQTDPARIRNLPKIVWILIIILLPIVGGIAWLVAGRPQSGSAGASVPWRSTRTAGFPEYERPQAAGRSTDAIDEQLRRDHERVDREHEEALRRWEAGLREREAGLQARERKLGSADPEYGTPEPD